MPRTVNFAEFCALPDGTVYSHLDGYIVEGLFRRDAVLYDGDRPIDFFETNLLAEARPGAEGPDGRTVFDRPGTHPGRLAIFRFDDEFVVYDKEDAAVLDRVLVQIPE